ncbi:ZN692 protein, partial [Upupa epops]|nr:ZN692 protein [Upupa epops]
RRQRRRALDSRRSRSRIRIGSHWEHWCRLKAQMGFSLHSQLAQFLLNRVTGTGTSPPSHPSPLLATSLQALVALSHSHGRRCGLLPVLRAPLAGSYQLLWECPAGHRFCWDGANG